MFCYCSAENKMSGGGFCFLFSKSLKSTHFHFLRTTRESMRTTLESTRTTCRATCQRHITREVGLKTGKKMSGEKKAKKK